MRRARLTANSIAVKSSVESSDLRKTMFCLPPLESLILAPRNNIPAGECLRGYYGAERGIRTPVQLPVTRFRVVRVRPLRHLCVFYDLVVRVGGRAAFVVPKHEVLSHRRLCLTTPPSLRFYDLVVSVDFTDFVILYYSVKKFKYF